MESLDLSLEATDTIEGRLIVTVLAEDVVPWWQSYPLCSSQPPEHVKQFRSKLAHTDRDGQVARNATQSQHSYPPAVSLFMADSCLCHRRP